MTTEPSQRMLRLSLPTAAITEAIADRHGIEEDRIYLEVPIALLQAALPEMVGRAAPGGEAPIVLELDDAGCNELDVAGGQRRSAAWERRGSHDALGGHD